MEDRAERAKRFANVFAHSRYDADVTQQYIALSLGVTRKTVKAWETGESCPNMFQAAEWFRTIGLNPLPYFLEFLYPSLFSIKGETNEVDEAIKAMLSMMSVTEKKQLLFLMSGRHGSSGHAMLQMMVANCHTSLRARNQVAHIIANNYEIEEATSGLVCPDDAMPDMEVFQNAISESLHSIKAGDSGYSGYSYK